MRIIYTSCLFFLLLTLFFCSKKEENKKVRSREYFAISAVQLKEKEETVSTLYNDLPIGSFVAKILPVQADDKKPVSNLKYQLTGKDQSFLSLIKDSIATKKFLTSKESLEFEIRLSKKDNPLLLQDVVFPQLLSLKFRAPVQTPVLIQDFMLSTSSVPATAVGWEAELTATLSGSASAGDENRLVYSFKEPNLYFQINAHKIQLIQPLPTSISNIKLDIVAKLDEEIREKQIVLTVDQPTIQDFILSTSTVPSMGGGWEAELTATLSGSASLGDEHRVVYSFESTNVYFRIDNHKIRLIQPIPASMGPLTLDLIAKLGESLKEKQIALTVMPPRLSSLEVREGGALPALYLGAGQPGPPIQVNSIPAGTASMIMHFVDLDHLHGAAVPLVCKGGLGNGNNPATHWLLYNIPPAATLIQSSRPPVGAGTAINSFGVSSYTNPSPAPRPCMHRYRFTVYFMKEMLIHPDFNQDTKGNRVETDYTDKILETAILNVTGTSR